MEQTLGKRIMSHRKRLGLTQDQLAEKLGVTAQAVSKWENDQSCPDISTLPRLAEIFGISVDALLGRAPEEPVYDGEVDTGEPEGLHVQKENWEFQLGGGKRGAFTFGILVLAVGCLTLADKLLLWGIGFWSILWPTALLIYGLSGLSRRFSFVSLGCGIFGTYFLLSNLNILKFALGAELVFPIILVLFGISLLVDALRNKGRRKHHVHVSGNSKKYRGECSTSGETFSCNTSFGENTHNITLPRLSHGSADVSFGALTVDLSQVDSLGERCVVDANCSFGELVLRVPRRFFVDPVTSTAFASVSIKGEPDGNPAGTIHLNADASFGEISVRYI